MALFGQILLSIDTTFDYEVKERIVVAYYRCKRNAYDAGDGTTYSYDATLAQFEDVVKLDGKDEIRRFFVVLDFFVVVIIVAVVVGKRYTWWWQSK